MQETLMPAQEIGVALLGLGNVGAGVIKLLAQNAESIQARLGARLVVRGVAVRDPKKERAVQVEPGFVTTDVEALIDRDDVQIVCELVGGEKLARSYALRAIEQGKHVVTANKALLAVHGDEIFAAAESKSVDVYYEAAVCGGVPIIRALREGLASDRIEEIHGIVNGTSNYILSEMQSEGRSFAAVLSEAQDKGYAEADPHLDVSGGDAAHKLAILVSLCFGTQVSLEDIFVEGIDGLEPSDFEFAKRIGHVIKPLAIARFRDGHLEARVHPTMVPTHWLLADVPGAMNALYVRSDALGSSLYYGAGAGMMPTAMAVVSDLIEVGRNIRADATGALPRLYDEDSPAALLPINELRSRYYFRFSVVDEPGVLGKLTTILGQHEVSLAQLIQEEVLDEPVRIVAVSHHASEGRVQEALAEIEGTSFCMQKPALIRIAT